MSDLIERQKVIDAVKDADVCVFYSDNQSIDDVLDYTIRATKGSVIASIEQLPSAQPEIVRCGQCKYYKKDHGWNCIEYTVCAISPIHKVIRKPDDFCSKAERRTDE